MCSTTLTSGLSASIAALADAVFGDADAVGGVDHLALQVRGVDDVVVDDADRADPGRREVERGRRTESAGAEQQHLRVQQLELALDPDLGQQGVARVAVALLGRELRDDRVAGLGPGDDAALDDGHVLVAQPAEHLGDLRGAVVGAALEQQALGAVGRDLVDSLGDLALRDVDRLLEVRLVPLVLLAHVDHAHAGFDLRPRLVNRDEA